MAGIGFALQKLLESKSLAKKFYAFLLATFISSGPWLFSMISLIFINIFSSIFIKVETMIPFRVTIIYVYAISIITSGPVQYLLTKYLADQHYIKKWSNFYPALFTAFIIQGVVSLIFIPLWLYLLSGADIIFKIVTILLYIVITYIWLMMDFLSASKRYLAIVYSFLIGSFLSVSLTILFMVIGKSSSIIISGFFLGQLFILFMLFFFAGRQFPFRMYINKEFLGYFKIYPMYLFIGGAYNLGLWSDKIIMWIVKGERIVFNYRIFDPYDFMIFIAYLSMIPALAFFLLKSETSFFVRYHTFYKSINKERLYVIEENFRRMRFDMYKAIFILSLIQFFSLIIFLVIVNSFDFFKFCSQYSVPLILASSFQVLFLFVLIYMMYFNLIIEATISSFMFFFLNVFLNLFQFIYPIITIGYGYFIATFFSFLFSLVILIYKIKDLIFNVFREQVVE